MKVLVVGAGLLGTSLGLALKAQGNEIWISDIDANRAALAADLIGAEIGSPTTDVTVVAVPTDSISEVVCARIEKNLGAIVTDLGSVKTKPLVEVAAKLGAKATSFIPGHPMAGRELSGPEGARADLFQGRPWILTPTAASSAEGLSAVIAMAESVGAAPVLMTAEEHDRSVASISHLPQLVASLVAGLIGHESDQSLALAGQGVKDLTRIAGSDPALWAGILTANAPVIVPLWMDFIAQATRIGEFLNHEDYKSIYKVIAQGNKGRLRLPGKHGGLSTNYLVVPVVIEDRPGQLGKLFAAAGDFGINIEDLSMEHSPGQPRGLVELYLAPEAAEGFVDFLQGRGWRVHPRRQLTDSTIER